MSSNFVCDLAAFLDGVDLGIPSVWDIASYSADVNALDVWCANLPMVCQEACVDPLIPNVSIPALCFKVPSISTIRPYLSGEPIFTATPTLLSASSIVDNSSPASSSMNSYANPKGYNFSVPTVPTSRRTVHDETVYFATEAPSLKNILTSQKKVGRKDSPKKLKSEDIKRTKKGPPMKAAHSHDGDIFICIQAAMTSPSLAVPALPHPGRAEQWRQKRIDARLRLDEKRIRWKALSCADVISNSSPPSHYRDRQVRARASERVGGRFVKKGHQQFQPI